MPRLVLDLSVLDQPVATGVERRAVAVARRLPALLRDWDVHGLAHCRPPFGSETVSDVAAAGLPRVLWRRLVLPAAALKLRADLLLSFVRHVPQARGVLALRTIHDVPPGLGGRRRAQLARPGPTICVSHATSVALRAMRRDGEALRVIHNGVDERFFARHAGEKEDLAVVIGTVRARRNPEVVVEALRRVRRARPEFRLIWIGSEAERAPAVEGADFVGALDDDAVVATLSRARLLISPSTLEGFGIPVLEGLAAGLPVVAADCSAVREIANDFVRFYESRDAAALAHAIAQVLETPPPAERGRAHAAAFSWDRCAEEHADYLRELYERKRAAMR